MHLTAGVMRFEMRFSCVTTVLLTALLAATARSESSPPHAHSSCGCLILETGMNYCRQQDWRASCITRIIGLEFFFPTCFLFAFGTWLLPCSAICYLEDSLPNYNSSLYWWEMEPLLLQHYLKICASGKCQVNALTQVLCYPWSRTSCWELYASISAT